MEQSHRILASIQRVSSLPCGVAWHSTVVYGMVSIGNFRSLDLEKYIWSPYI